MGCFMLEKHRSMQCFLETSLGVLTTNLFHPFTPYSSFSFTVVARILVSVHTLISCGGQTLEYHLADQTSQR
jgi:hypothetical protein